MLFWSVQVKFCSRTDKIRNNELLRIPRGDSDYYESQGHSGKRHLPPKKTSLLSIRARLQVTLRLLGVMSITCHDEIFRVSNVFC